MAETARDFFARGVTLIAVSRVEDAVAGAEILPKCSSVGGNGLVIAARGPAGCSTAEACDLPWCFKTGGGGMPRNLPSRGSRSSTTQSMIGRDTMHRAKAATAISPTFKWLPEKQMYRGLASSKNSVCSDATYVALVRTDDVAPVDSVTSATPSRLARPAGGRRTETQFNSATDDSDTAGMSRRLPIAQVAPMYLAER